MSTSSAPHSLQARFDRAERREKRQQGIPWFGVSFTYLCYLAVALIGAGLWSLVQTGGLGDTLAAWWPLFGIGTLLVIGMIAYRVWTRQAYNTAAEKLAHYMAAHRSETPTPEIQQATAAAQQATEDYYDEMDRARTVGGISRSEEWIDREDEIRRNGYGSV